jgi:hypothetical protein
MFGYSIISERPRQRLSQRCGLLFLPNARVLAAYSQLRLTLSYVQSNPEQATPLVLRDFLRMTSVSVEA